MDAFEARLRAVDAAKLTPWVRSLLEAPDYVIDTVRLEPLTAGFSEGTVGTGGAYRYSGQGHSARGKQPWSLVLKMLRMVEGVGGTAPRDWNYRRRETLAYRSGLLDDLPGGIAAPRCLAVETPVDGETWIWLEEARQISPRWDMAQYGRVARHLGQFNGAYLAGRPIPERRWFTRGRVRSWLDLSRVELDDLPAFLASRTAPHWVTGKQAERVSALWAQRAPLLKRFDALPRCLCHHDAFPRNLFAGPDKTIAIDWQIMGSGVVGEELMPLVGVSLHFLHMSPKQARELEAVVLDGYTSGLRDAGWHGDERLVRLGFRLATGLFCGVACVGMWKSLADEERRDRSAEILGGSIEEVLSTWRELQDYFLDLTDEAIALSETLN